jgi:hypothetical protein
MKPHKKILIALSAVGPGLFLIGYNIGTGSVTTMAKTGAEHGMSLLWALVLSCIFTYLLMVAYGKLTLVSGKTALFNIRTSFRGGWILAAYILLALIIGELLALMGVMGIVADLVQEGIRLLFNQARTDTAWIILVLVIGLGILLWYGKYQAFDGICYPDGTFIHRGILHGQAGAQIPCQGNGTRRTGYPRSLRTGRGHCRYDLFSRGFYYPEYRGGGKGMDHPKPRNRA